MLKLRKQKGETMVTSVLTNREREIKELLLQGLSYKEIAEKMIVSEATVKAHNSNIYSKLGARGRMELQALELKKLKYENEKLKNMLNLKFISN